MVLEAGYPSTTGFRKVTKATILVRKKPSMSDADFIEHYNHVHANMAAPVLLKHNVISYSLTYHLQRDRQIMSDMLHLSPPSDDLPASKTTDFLLPYDAICTFTFPSYKDFAKFMYDPGSKALTSDHDNFMVEGDMRMMVGDEFVVVDEGKMVEKIGV